MTLFCIGWIPHLNGEPFLTNRWWNVIDEKKYDGEGTYFQVKPTTLGGEPDHPFNVRRISAGGWVGDKQIVENVTNFLDQAIYVAQCRRINDKNIKDRSLFVFTFSDNSLTRLDTVYIFKSVKNSFRRHDVTLLYRGTILVNEITPSGFITLSLQGISTRIKNRDEISSKQLLLEAFLAVRDVLHSHTHHLSTSTHGVHEVPDNVIKPVFSENQMDQVNADRTLNRYKKSLLYHLELIADLSHRTEHKKIPVRKGYSEISSAIKQANGCLTYCHQLLHELKEMHFVDDSNEKSIKRMLKHMKHSFKHFSEDLDSRFQIDITGASEILLIITAFLTMWIVYFEIERTYHIPEFSIWIPLAITIVSTIYYIYKRFSS